LNAPLLAMPPLAPPACRAPDADNPDPLELPSRFGGAGARAPRAADALVLGAPAGSAPLLTVEAVAQRIAAARAPKLAQQLQQVEQAVAWWDAVIPWDVVRASVAAKLDQGVTTGDAVVHVPAGTAQPDLASELARWTDASGKLRSSPLVAERWARDMIAMLRRRLGDGVDGPSAGIHCSVERKAHTSWTWCAERCRCGRATCRPVVSATIIVTFDATSDALEAANAVQAASFATQ
jgi:hypothetical protein